MECGKRLGVESSTTGVEGAGIDVRAEIVAATIVSTLAGCPAGVVYGLAQARASSTSANNAIIFVFFIMTSLNKTKTLYRLECSC